MYELTPAPSPSYTSSLDNIKDNPIFTVYKHYSKLQSVKTKQNLRQE